MQLVMRHENDFCKLRCLQWPALYVETLTNPAPTSLLKSLMSKTKEKGPRKAAKKLNAKEELDRELRRRRLQLQFLVTREEFLTVWPVLQAASKNLAGVTGLVFAGSLTFLGLSNAAPFDDLILLKLSWGALAISIIAHVFVYIAGLDSHINHVRTETHSNTSKKIFELKDAETVVSGLQESIRAHWYQAVFFRSNRYLAIALVLQVFGLILGGILMGMFITENI